MTRDVIIVGGGFAGLSAARRLGRRRDLHVRLIDPREHQQSLPLLPDLIGRNLSPDWLRYPLAHAARRWGFEHVRNEAVSLDLTGMTVVAGATTYRADAMLLACGCSPVPCPFAMGTNLHRLSDVNAAVALRAAFIGGSQRNWVVVGGGYTGVETATHLWRCAQVEGLSRRIFVVERGDVLCGAMGSTFAAYVDRNVTSLGIEAMHRTRVVGVREGDVLLDGDRRVTAAGVVWAVGVEGQRLAQAIDAPRTPTGRLSVDASLRLAGPGAVFVAGDAAGFLDAAGRPLRPSVQAAVMQGRHAADNILRHFDGRPLRPYRHRDLGFVVPMANGRGCGIALGLPVYGRLPLLLHAVMSVYRSFGAGCSPVLLARLLRGSAPKPGILRPR